MTEQIWQPDLYQNKHSFVPEYGKELLNYLKLNPEDHILDLGCGTGEITDLIAQKVKRVTAIDNSKEMVDAFQSTMDNITLIQKDIRDIDYVNTFDSIFCHAVMHWISKEDHPGLCRKLYASLKKGGSFVVEFGGKGNVAALVEAIQSAIESKQYKVVPFKNVWFFPTISQYSTMLESSGFEVTYARLFDRSTLLDDKHAIQNWIKMFGMAMLAHVPEKAHGVIFEKIEHMLKSELFDEKQNKWFLDYRRIQIIAKKEGSNFEN